MADRTWKAFERRMARMFGTERIPAAGVMGLVQKDAPDFSTPLLAFQAKKGYSLPAYLRQWLTGVVAAAGASRRGVVVWAGKGERDSEALCIMRASDFAVLASLAEQAAQSFDFSQRAGQSRAQ